jgi:hypothetical protein
VFLQCVLTSGQAGNCLLEKQEIEPRLRWQFHGIELQTDLMMGAL